MSPCSSQMQNVEPSRMVSATEPCTLLCAPELATLAPSGDREARVSGLARRPRPCFPPPTEGSLPPVARAELDRHRATVIDLEGRVVDAEALVEQLLELAADRMAIVAGVDEHVRGKRREARADLPDVQVVHALDVRMGGDRGADRLDAHPGRRRLEQDAARVAQEPVG